MDDLICGLALLLLCSAGHWIAASFFSSLFPHRTKYNPDMISTAPMILCIAIPQYQYQIVLSYWSGLPTPDLIISSNLLYYIYSEVQNKINDKRWGREARIQEGYNRFQLGRGNGDALLTRWKDFAINLLWHSWHTQRYGWTCNRHTKADFLWLGMR